MYNAQNYVHVRTCTSESYCGCHVLLGDERRAGSLGRERASSVSDEYLRLGHTHFSKFGRQLRIYMCTQMYMYYYFFEVRILSPSHKFTYYTHIYIYMYMYIYNYIHVYM